MSEGFSMQEAEADMRSFPRAPPPTPVAPVKKRATPKITKEDLQKLNEVTIKDHVDEEDEAERNHMVRQINLYYRKLGHKIHSKPPKITAKTPIAKIKEVLFNIRQDLASSNAERFLEQTYIGVVNAIERGNDRFNITDQNINGFTAATVGTRDQWKDMIDELSIEYGYIFARGPFIRLVFQTLQTMQAVAMHNAMSEGATVDPETVDIDGLK